MMNLAEALNILVKNEYLVESAGVREATYEEFKQAFDDVVRNEIDLYYTDYPDDEKEEVYESFMASIDDIWDMRIHAYTTDGTDSLVLTPNKDGSHYVYSMYIRPEKRDGSAAIALFKQALKDSPNGMSFHTHKGNKLARAALRLGFKEYPSSNPHEIFMANKEGIGGNEYWANEN